MEPYTMAVKLKLCNICKTEMALVYCDTCHVKLCNGCIGKHMESKESKEKHEIVKIGSRKSNPFYIYPSCTSHNKERCVIYCKKCKKPVCNNCIASNRHLGHKFVKILKVLDEKKENIIKELKELKDPILPKYQNIAHDVEDMIKNLEKGYGDLSIAITKHGEEWHQEIDNVVTKLKAKVDKIKNEHFKNLKSVLNETNKKISKIRERINTINSVNINPQDILELFSIPFNIDIYRQPPPYLALSFPTFIPLRIQGEKFSSLFGTISPSKLTSETTV